MTKLTIEQHDAVTSPKNIVVIASAGTGKTMVLAERFANVLQTTPLTRVIALTFTEKATREMQERILKKTKLSPESLPLVNVMTLHGFCGNVLRQFGKALGLAEDFTILKEHAYNVWLEEKIRTHIAEHLTSQNSVLNIFYQKYGFKNLLRTAKDLLTQELENAHTSTALPQHFLDDIQTLQNTLLAERIRGKTLCYDDLETLTLKLLRTHAQTHAALRERYTHILVDEAQDLSPRQLLILKFIFDPAQNKIFVVGDPKQSIYGFRHAGASVFAELIDLVKNADGRLITLSETFRTPQKIQDFFNRIFPKVFSEATPDLAYTQIQTHNRGGNEKITTIQIPKDGDLTLAVVACAEALLQNGAEAKNIAVLSATRGLFPKLNATLTGKGIAVASESKIPLYDDDFVRFCHHAFLHLGGKHDNITMIGLLCNPLIRLSEEAVVEILHSGETEFEKFSIKRGTEEDKVRLQHLQKEFSVWKKNVTASPQELVWTIFRSVVKKPDSYLVNACLHFADILASWQAQGYENPTKMIPLLESLATSEVSIETVASPQDGVRLLSIHAAKGLEFDHVILIPATRKRADTRVALKQNAELFLFKEAAKNCGLHHELEETEEFAAYKQELKAREKDETRRLLYVALTRTKKNLFIFGNPPSNAALAKAFAKNPEDVSSIPDYNNWLAWLVREI